MTAATGLVVCAIGGAAQATVSGWRWESPAPLGRVMRGVAVAGSLSYAIGDDGVLLRSDDGGAHWTVLDAGMSEPVQRLQVIDESTLVIGEGELGCHTLISTDAGETFTPIFNSAKAKCVPVAAFSFLSPRIGFLLLSDGAVEMTGDGGGTFSARAAIPGSTAVTGIVHEGDYTTHEVLGVEIHFRSPTSGIAFLTPSFRSPGYKGSVNLSTGPSVAYTTSDGGSSWSPVALPADAQVKTVDFVNDRVAYAAGPGTLLYSADGGATWEALPVLQYETPEGVACFTAASCVLQSGVTTKLMALHGNATPTELAHPSLPICMAGNQLPSQIVSLGGPAPDNASLLSGEAGLSCPPESSRPEVEYLGLMQGPGKLVYAPGSDGRLALSADEGQSWKVIATPSSWPLAGLVFADPRFGLALGGKDGRRILWQTKDGGAIWQRLAAGTSHARAVTLVGKRIALAIDFHSISRSILGGPFKPVARHIKGFADIAEFDRAGSAVCAYGAHVLLQSTDAGAHWQRLRLPRSGRQSVSIVSVSFVSRSRGYLLDRSGRLWLTRDGGMRWRQILSTGQTASTYREEVYFANARVGFLAGFDYPGDEDRAYLLHTTDGGATWAPELVGPGWLASGVVASGSGAAVVLQEPHTGDEGTMFYAATNGGAVGGTHARVALHASQRTVSVKPHGAVWITIAGKLSTGASGERIIVSRRPLGDWMWAQKLVRTTADGKFRTSWPLGRTSVFVAQWAGDESHPGAGSRPLTISVTSR